MAAYVARHFILVLLGKIGAGKSASGNTILGREVFVSLKSCTTVTKDVVVESGTVCGFPVTVYDTPGLSDIDMSEEEIEQMINVKVLQKCASGRCVFLLVIKADRFTEEERKTVEKIEKILGEKHLKNSWILFTRGDELEEENMTIQEFINQSVELETLVQKYEHRYHLFNNKKQRDAQVKILLTKILDVHLDTMTTKLKQASLKRQKPTATLAERLSSFRIVLLGKSGVGKSAAGNTILGQKEFISEMSTKSVTLGCSLKCSTVSGRFVSVVDTPGLFDTRMNTEELMMEITRSVYISSPGPHAFLIVLRLDQRFTEQEQQIPQLIERMFGEEVLKYSIILFTHGDLLDGDPIEEVIKECEPLRSLVQQCGGRYHVFNNEDVDNREQVEDLLQKIDSLIQQNGGAHYTNQMYEDAQRVRQEEEKRRQREKQRRQSEEKIQRLREKQRQLMENQRKRTEERRRRAEEFRRRIEEQRRLREEQRILREEQRTLIEEQRRRREEQMRLIEEQRTLIEEQIKLLEEQRRRREEQMRLIEELRRRREEERARTTCVCS